MNRTLAFAALLLGFILLAPSAEAQVSTAYGEVLDVEGQPIADAEILVEFTGGVSRSYKAKTNEKGEWLQMVRYGPYRFTVTKDGFEPFVFEQQIPLGQQVHLPPVTLLAAGGVTKKLLAEFDKAVELTKAGELDQAAAKYREILETTPDILEVHLNLAMILDRQKDYAGAEVEYLKALELRPDSGDAAVSLAGVYQHMGEADKMKPLLEQTADSTDANLQFKRGLLLMNALETDAAGEAFQAAITADPTLTEAYFHLGSVKLNQGKIPEAVADLEKYLSLEPTDTANVATAQSLVQALKE